VMGLQIVAEFVESEAILSALGQLGVDYAQGYWVGAPRPLGELMDRPTRAGRKFATVD